MSTIANLGFEDAAIAPGFADLWNVENVTARGVFAEFADARAVERFESGWTNGGYSLTHDPLSPRALFSGDVYVSPVSAESFEAGWTNTSYMLTSFAAIGAVFAPDSDPFDGFGKGWDNSPYLYAFSGGELSASVHDGNGFENFEQGWGNSGYAFAWVGGETVAPSLSGALAKSAEDFAGLPAQLYGVDTVGDYITHLTGHGLGAGYSLVFAQAIGGALPVPVVPALRYYVSSVASVYAFQVQVDPSIPQIDLTTAGSGLLKWSAPWEFWTAFMATI